MYIKWASNIPFTVFIVYLLNFAPVYVKCTLKLPKCSPILLPLSAVHSCSLFS